MASSTDKVLVTGGDGFTAQYLLPRLREQGYQVCATSRSSATGHGLRTCDITIMADVLTLVEEEAPDYIVHLAGISYTEHDNALEFYEVNLFGALNVLEASRQSIRKPRRIILAGSAAVYGRREGSLDETLCPAPVGHYALSKLCLEHMAADYLSELDIIVTRPFNYTGPGQSRFFVIPKIVGHFLRRAQYIELGNIDVIREFNDVRMVVELYARLLKSRVSSMVINLCSGRGYSLRQVLQAMQDLTGTKMQVIQSPQLMRPNEIRSLTGDPSLLQSSAGRYYIYSLEETLNLMLQQAGPEYTGP